MTDSRKRAERREQQAIEIEANQAKLQASIAESDRLVGEADNMLRRPRKECEEDDEASVQRPNSNCGTTQT
jgi:hypothetical protein